MRRTLLLLGVAGLALALALVILARAARRPATGAPASATPADLQQPGAPPLAAPAPIAGQGPSAAAGPGEDRTAVPPPSVFESDGPHCSLWGRVLDGGRAVPRFTLMAEPIEEMRDRGPDGPHAFADPQGRFELALPDGRWRVRAVAGRRTTGDAVEVRVPRAEELTLELVPTSAISGTVRDPSGAPTVAEVFSLEDFRARGADGVVTSTREGSFKLEGLGAGAHRLIARRPGLAPSDPIRIELAPGEHVERVELRLRVGARVHGLVLDRAGRPEAGLHVVLRAQSPNATRPASASTDAQGAFELAGVPAGSWQVAVQEDQVSQGAGGPLRLALVELADGDDVELVLGGLLPEPVRVRGVALDADGSPLADADLVTLAEGEGLLGSANQIELEEDGRFDVLLAAPGRIVFGLQDDERLQTFPVQVPAAGLDDLVLRMPGGSIAGRVLDASGASARAAEVFAWRVEELTFLERIGEAVPTRADDGRFALSGLPAGTWSLQARDGRSIASLARPLQLAAGASIEGVELRLVEGGSVEGVVIDVAGAPVAGASVFARGGDGAWSLPFGAATFEDGRFIMPLPAGDHTLLARAPGQASQESEAVEVAAGASAIVELVVVPAARLELALLDARGSLVPARFRVEDARGRRMTGIVAAHARQEFLREGFSSLEPRVGPLAPGAYRVLATSQDGRTASAEVNVGGASLQRVELRLD